MMVQQKAPVLHFARRDKPASAAAAAAAVPSSGQTPPATSARLSLPSSPLLRRIPAPDPRPQPSIAVIPSRHGAPSPIVPAGPPPPRPARRPSIDRRLCSRHNLPSFNLPLSPGMSRRSPESQTLPKPLLAPPQMETAASAEKTKTTTKKKLPPWIDPLIRSTFFERCSSHPQWYGSNRRCPAKNGCNFMCVDCCIPICSRCTQEEEEHRGHRAVQIRVSSFNNVVKVEDIKPFFDVAQVQTYLIYGFRVVCINKRQKSTGRWPGSGGDAGSSTCKVCSRALKGTHAFCSIECKVCDYASAAAQRQNTEVSKATMTMMSGARKRARKATPQRAHLGCTL